MNQKNYKRVAVFGALCFFFSTIEYLFPKPLPFLRLGFANIPLLVGLNILNPADFFLVVIIKIIGQGLLGGTLFSYIFLFSAAGTASSALVMFGLKKISGNLSTSVGISVSGAFVSNCTQLLLARFILFGKTAWLIAPPFLLAGTITSVFLGLFADWFMHNSSWFSALKNDSFFEKPIEKTKNEKEQKNAALFFFCGLGFLPFLFFAPNVYFCAIVFCVILCIAVFLPNGLLKINTKRRIKPLPYLIMSFFIIFFNILTPAGKVLIEIAHFRLTSIALQNGIQKALTLSGMLLLSRWMIRPHLVLPGKIGELISFSFLILEKLTEQKKYFNRKNILESIDKILFEVVK